MEWSSSLALTGATPSPQPSPARGEGAGRSRSKLHEQFLCRNLVTPMPNPHILTFDCIILRGLPGSGKSTLAEKLATEHGYLHLEADQHFTLNGVYRFDPARVADAHAVVARDALSAMQANRRVVIANTHVRLWEMAAIIGAAQLAGKSLCFVECTGAWGNIHAVPEDTITRMQSRWEPLPAKFGAVSFREPVETPNA